MSIHRYCMSGFVAFAIAVGLASNASAALPQAAQDKEIAALKAEVSHAAHKLALLKSREAILNLQTAYGYYIDKGKWNQAAGLFADNGTYEFGQRGVYVGPAHIRKALSLFGPEGLREGQLNDYPMLQPIIDVAPDNKTAKARWRSDVMLADHGKGEWAAGTYENEYVNDHGTWKISKLHYYVTFIGGYKKGWIADSRRMKGPSKTLPPDHPPTVVYKALPDVNMVPYHYGNPVTTATPSTEKDVHGPAGLPADLAALQRKANALAHNVELLKDHAAIEKLQRAYGYYVDKAQWPDIAHLFAKNGTYEIGGRGVFIGPKRVLEYLVTGLGPVGIATRHGGVINHQQFEGIVNVAPDGKTAAGRWTAFVVAGGKMGAAWGDCTYENRYVKVNGVWKASSIRGPFNMYAPYKGGWKDHAIPNTRPDSFAPPPDLPPTTIYLTYPSFYNNPFHYRNFVTGKKAPPPNPAAGGTVPMSNYVKK